MRGFVILLILFVFTPSLFAQGVPLIPFKAKWINGPNGQELYKSKRHKKGIFIFHSVMTSCRYNYTQAETLKDMADHYRQEKRVQILDYVTDQRLRNVNSWIDNTRPNHPVLHDEGHVLHKKFKEAVDSPVYFPSTIIVDCHGIVHDFRSGPWDPRARREIYNLVDDLLENICQ